MKTIPYRVSILSLWFLIHLFAPAWIFAQTVREPVFAGTWYPGTKTELDRTIHRFTQKAKKTDVRIPPGSTLKALILPHAGHIYSGLTAAHAVHVLGKNDFSKIILMGPDHRIGFMNGAISNVSYYRTPMGKIKLHWDARKLSGGSRLFRSIPESDQQEHCLEIVLPFLQYMLKDFEIIPIVLGPTDVSAMADAVDAVLDPQTLVVVSSDLSHGLPFDEAEKKDRETIRSILDLAEDRFSKSRNAVCGKIPIMVLMNLSRRHRWRPVLLHYSNSGHASGMFKQVVGYTAMAFFEKKTVSSEHDETFGLDEKNGRRLIRLARISIRNRLSRGPAESNLDSFYRALSAPCFQMRSGTFVTLTQDGRLRGCMGNLISESNLVQGIIKNAVNAAFHDPRFPALTLDELKSIRISVSILSRPRVLDYRGPEDLISRLRVGIDGVILSKGGARATFLPQVWKQLPLPEEFLSGLCRKAGLSGNTWRNTRLDIQTYQVQYFEE